MDIPAPGKDTLRDVETMRSGIFGAATNTLRTPLVFLLASSFALACAHAHEPVTRAQVIADYQEAVRTGDLMAPGDSGMKLNELYPGRYEKALTSRRDIAATSPATDSNRLQ